MRIRPTRPILAIFVLLAAGCAESQEANVMADPTTGRANATGVTPANSPRSSADYYRAGGGGMGGGTTDKTSAPVKTIGVTGGGFEEAESKRPDPAVDPTPRKILYTADIALTVDDFPKLETAILKLVKRSEGYLADTDVSGSAGASRTARWKIRIPIDKFESFLESAGTLGELTHRQINSQDVTEEFYDLDARIKNKKVEEARLLKHLQDSTGKLQEILAAERELSRVREEVERQEGRLRLLANLAALTTITITATERTQFVPTTAPTFSTRASRQFEDSIKGLVDFVQGATLWVIGIAPWLPIYILLAIPTYLIYRRIRRRVVAHLNPPRPAAP